MLNERMNTMALLVLLVTLAQPYALKRKLGCNQDAYALKFSSTVQLYC
jgi:hypothetical protein